MVSGPLARSINRRLTTAREQLATCVDLARNEWERNFVNSVTEQVNEYARYPTAAQQRIIDRILSYAEAEDDGPYAGVSDLLQRAGSTLRRPRITFEVDMTTVRVSLAPANGRNPNNAYITIGGDGTDQSYREPEHTYYGRITPGGVLVASGATELHGTSDEAITTFLTDLAEDPAGAAREYGARTGRCCFCGQGLTTVESTSHGYGPVCARSWGLPWSRSSANAILDAEAEANRAVVAECNAGMWEVIDTENGDVIATFESRVQAIRYADEWSEVQRQAE